MALVVGRERQAELPEPFVAKLVAKGFAEQCDDESEAAVLYDDCENEAWRYIEQHCHAVLQA